MQHSAAQIMVMQLQSFRICWRALYPGGTEPVSEESGGASELTYGFSYPDSVNDAENRLESANSTKQYSYDPENLRVYDGSEYHFYAPDGRRMGKYAVPPPSSTIWTTTEVYVYFNGRMIASATPLHPGTPPPHAQFFAVLTDRVGSVRVGKTGAMNYYPYGQERAVTGNGQNKFGTYWRDSVTGLDYAQQRYYSPGTGRFLSADPSMPEKLRIPRHGTCMRTVARILSTLMILMACTYGTSI